MIALGQGWRWKSHCGASEASGAPLDDNAGPGMRWESRCGASEASGAPLDEDAGPGMRWDSRCGGGEASGVGGPQFGIIPRRIFLGIENEYGFWEQAL